MIQILLYYQKAINNQLKYILLGIQNIHWCYKIYNYHGNLEDFQFRSIIYISISYQFQMKQNMLYIFNHLQPLSQHMHHKQNFQEFQYIHYIYRHKYHDKLCIQLMWQKFQNYKLFSKNNCPSLLQNLYHNHSIRFNLPILHIYNSYIQGGELNNLSKFLIDLEIFRSHKHRM